MSLPTFYLRPLIGATTSLVGLPWWRGWSPAEWFEALILQESAGNPKAIRYERHHDSPGRSDSAGDADTPDKDDGLLEDDASYGLCQVLGTNIRVLCGVAYGVPMNFGFALLPITNIALGLRMISGELKATDQSVARALARYNGGPSGDETMGGGMRRQVYVDGVAAWAARVQKEVA